MARSTPRPAPATERRQGAAAAAAPCSTSRARRPGPRGAFTAELGEAYLALLRETGNARASARTLGHPYLFDNRKRYDPAFKRACAAAATAADAELRLAESPFLPPIEVKSMPPPGGGKRRPAAREPAIRRTSNGRFQISYVPEGKWTSEHEADFLARLRETGNFNASARAVGFHPCTVHRRIAQWPAFGRDCDEAIEAASAKLDYILIAHAHALLRRPGEAAQAGGEDDPGVPFDPEAAMRILAFIDRRRRGRTTRGPRGAPPGRTFAQAVDSVLAKVAAIERHEELLEKRKRDGRT